VTSRLNEPQEGPDTLSGYRTWKHERGRQERRLTLFRLRTTRSPFPSTFAQSYPFFLLHSRSHRWKPFRSTQSTTTNGTNPCFPLSFRFLLDIPKFSSSRQILDFSHHALETLLLDDASDRDEPEQTRKIDDEDDCLLCSTTRNLAKFATSLFFVIIYATEGETFDHVTVSVRRNQVLLCRSSRAHPRTGVHRLCVLWAVRPSHVSSQPSLQVCIFRRMPRRTGAEDDCLRYRQKFGQDRQDPNALHRVFLAGATAGAACALLETPVSSKPLGLASASR